MSPPDLNAVVAKHLRQAISEIRATKTSISKGRGRLPCGDDETELLEDVRALYQVEKRLLARARKLEATERYAARPTPEAESIPHRGAA